MSYLPLFAASFKIVAAILASFIASKQKVQLIAAKENDNIEALLDKIVILAFIAVWGPFLLNNNCLQLYKSDAIPYVNVVC